MPERVSPTLLNLPIAVAKQVLEKLEPMDRLTCRKVCKSLRTAIDTIGINFDSITFEVEDDYVKIIIKNLIIHYTNSEIAVDTEKKKIIKTQDFMERALKDLGTLIKYAKMLRIMEREFHEDVTPLLEVLESKKPLFAHQIILYAFRLSEIQSILPYFDAKSLTGIILWDIPEEPDSSHYFEQITQLEQWKSAKFLLFRDFSFDNLPFEQLFHFEKFIIELETLTIEHAIKIRDDLMKRDTFRECTIWFKDNDSFDEIFSPELNERFTIRFEEEEDFEFGYESEFKFFVKRN